MLNRGSKGFLKGAFILAAAGLLSKVLGIFFKIPLQRLIHDEGMGLFGLPYPIYTVMLSISIIGFPAAISKLIAEKTAVNDIAGARQIFRVSLSMLAITGAVTSIILYFGAPGIITLLDWPQEAYYSIIGLAFAPFFVSLMSAFRGYFQGMEVMFPTAISQITEQSGRVIIGVVLAYTYINQGIGYAAGAASFGATMGAFLGLIPLLIYYFKIIHPRHRKIREQYRPKDNYRVAKQILIIAIPITIGAILSSVMALVDAILVPARLLQGGYTVEGGTILYGQLTGKAVTLINVPLTFSMAMAASLVPTISQSFSRNNVFHLREKATTGIKVTMLIALPATIGLMLLASPIIHLLWGANEAGGEILSVLAINVVFISLAQSLTSILQGIGKVYIPVRNLMIGVLVKIIISYILLVSHWNILGAVIGSICGYVIVMLLNYISVKRLLKLKLSLLEVLIKPLIAAGGMGITTLYSFKYLTYYFSSEGIVTLGTIFISITVYFILITILGSLNLKESRDFFR
ncbi:polysaccharide biosynthesis protein [Alkaliphilus metalliredigens QYMF]|uniref:Polysaccharide biosynthesis protein n=1 Tax=Alkaliphilus metalliredigens (strain QYMF) TaxID=293826 RepID=A6TN15_ALKMQ|nr:polysaccharide biosynthesis protein [Alkaliphilus metalliredigens]ABR47583.1 polysaccharide biosynthesis protein [Alkaliphilus metalliredigens QYMF]